MQNLYRLETSCYEQNQLINHLNERLNRLKSMPDKKHIRGNYKDESGLGLYIFIFPFIIGYLLCGFVSITVGCIVGGIVLLVEWLIFRPTEEKAYNKQERARVLAENQRIDAYNEQFRSQLPARCTALSTQISRTKKSLDNTRTALNRLYALDVIYPKYRNMAAVTSFYEYFCSGRCTSLTGHEGAYNIFEQEVRMGIVIDKLDLILERLDQIESNQYMIARAIKQSNERAEQIYAKMSECADRLQSIDENTLINGYFNAITAANTAALARYCRNQ